MGHFQQKIHGLDHRFGQLGLFRRGECFGVSDISLNRRDTMIKCDFTMAKLVTGWKLLCLAILSDSVAVSRTDQKPKMDQQVLLIF